jgi:hypothetical protein
MSLRFAVSRSVGEDAFKYKSMLNPLSIEHGLTNQPQLCGDVWGPIRGWLQIQKPTRDPGSYRGLYTPLSVRLLWGLGLSSWHRKACSLIQAIVPDSEWARTLYPLRVE